MKVHNIAENKGFKKRSEQNAGSYFSNQTNAM